MGVSKLSAKVFSKVNLSFNAFTQQEENILLYQCKWKLWS